MRVVDRQEPFTRLLTQGMVLKDGQVRSKSKGNVVDPDDMIQKYGADALRLYVMFVAPPEKEIEWTDAGLEGSFRFLARVWRLVDQLSATFAGKEIPAVDDLALDEGERALRRKTHETIRRVTLPAARDLAQFGIRVMTIAPGILDTPMLAGVTEEIRAGLAASVPFPARLGLPVEYAALVVSIAAQDYLNGEVIRLDGSLRRAPR